MTDNYVFDLAIQRRQRKYLAQVVNSPAGQARHEFTLPFGDDQLSALSAWTTGAPWPLPQLSPQEFYSHLYHSIFGGEVGKALRRSKKLAKQERHTLHIHLNLDGVPELASLRWELLYDPRLPFAREFYAALADGRAVDAALSEGRKAIYQCDSVDWATPVLFMRTPDGQLFRQPVIKEQKAEDAAPKPENNGQPAQTNHQPAANRRMALFLIGTLSSLLGNVIAGLINLNQVWSIVAIVFVWLLLVGVELWLTRVEAHGASLPIPKVWVEPKVLVRAGALLLTILVAVISIPRLLPSSPACPPGKQCVLVARFTPETSLKAQEMTDHLADEIRRVLTAAAGDDIALAIGEPVTNEEEARSLAERQGALLVVWGTVRESEDLTMVHFQMADLLGITESKSVRPYRAEPMLYDPVDGRFQCTTLDIEAAATRQVSMVAYVAVGLARYASDQPEAAQANFSAALHCAGEVLDADIIPISQSVCAPGDPISSRQPGLIYYYLGKSLIQEGSYHRGIEMLKLAAVVNPDDPAAWIGIGSALQGWSGQPTLPEAVEAFAQAKRLLDSPRMQSASLRHFHLGLIHELQRDYPAAVAAYESARQRMGADAPDSYNILIALGRTQRLADESDAAAVTLERAIELVPESPWAYLELARVHSRDQAVALSWIEKAMQSDPRQAYTFIVRAELCQRWDDWPCALEFFEKALTLRQSSSWIHNQLGYLYIPQNPAKSGQDWNQALYYLELGAEARREDPWVHDQLAYVYSNLGRYDDAVRYYQSAIELAYSDNVVARSYCNLGSTYAQSKNPDAARVNYQACADHAIDPDLQSWAAQRIADLTVTSE